MHIFRPKDQSLIIRETDVYLIFKFHAVSDLHIVVDNAKQRQYGCVGMDAAIAFAQRRGWETSEQERLERYSAAAAFRHRNPYNIQPLDAYKDFLSVLTTEEHEQVKQGIEELIHEQ